MTGLLNNLCSINGVSGDEQRVRGFIESRISGSCESIHTDALGNLIAFKKGRSAGKKFMVCAHMDEVGFIITHINSDGTLSFSEVGGIDPSVVIGRQVLVGKDMINGVVGSTAVHNLSKEAREKPPTFSGMSIDIGASSKEEAEKYVSPGDCAYFCPDFMMLGSRIKSKAIDDRAGCAMMIRLMEEELPYDTYFVFNVQEEIGLRGSAASAFSVAPDFALVLEATTAADIDGVSGGKKVCCLGGGPVVSFMDRRTIYDKEMYRLAFDTAAELGLPCQTKTAVAGGNDAGAIHISGKGVRTLAVSLPCRYLHSPACVIESADLDSTYRLVRELVRRIPEL